MSELALMLGAYALGMVVSGVIGFGGLLIPFALLSFVLDDLKVLFLPFAYGAVARTITGAYLFRSYMRADIFWCIVIPATPALLIGGYVAVLLPSDIIRAGIGVFTLLFVFTKAFPQLLPTGAPSVRVQQIWAAVWGFVSGGIASGGPILASMLTQLKLEKNVFIATIQSSFLVATTLKLLMYQNIPSPYATVEIITVIILLSVLGAWAGKRIVKYVPEVLFGQIILVALFFSGLKMLL